VELKPNQNLKNPPLSNGQRLNNGFKKAEDYWNDLGPGLTTGAADDDPSGIATYSQAGSQFGFSFLWLALFTFPFMGIVQEMCARVGIVTGRGLAGNIRKHYSKKVLYVATLLLFAANTFNIGANLGAMAQATKLLIPKIPFTFLIIVFAVVSLSLQIFTSYKHYSKYLKWLALILLSYIFSLALLDLDFKTIFSAAILPKLEFNKNYIFLLCAILGTTISPYLFFWQTSQEVEEEIMEGKNTIKKRQEDTAPETIRKMRTDVWSGMFLSNLVMFAIIATCAVILFQNGITNIQTASQAAEALRPFAGKQAFLLFTLGIIGTGMLAVPILAGSASYALSETWKWKFGLYRKFNQAKSFYGVIILSMLLGLVLNFVGLDPIKALIYSAVLNGLISPIILILIVQISGNEKIMGTWKNGNITNALGWLITVIMLLTAVATIAALLF